MTSQLLSQTVSRYGYKQGLNAENVVYINQDQAGVLWIGSDDGSITSYNGWEFKQLPSREIMETTPLRVKCVTRVDDYILVVTTNSILVLKDNAFSMLYKGNVRSVVTKGDSLLFVDQQMKLNLILDKNIESLLLSENIESILLLAGNILLLTDSDKVLNLDSDNSTTPRHDFRNAEVFTFLNYSVFKSGASLLAMPTGLKQKIPDDISQNGIHQVIVDETSKSIWLLSHGDLFLIEPWEITKLSKPLSFTNDEVNYIFKDFEENIWAGTSNGLYKVHKSKFQFAGNVQPRDRITSISKAWNNQLIVGTERGKLNFINNMKLTDVKRFENLTIESVNSLRFDTKEDILWLGTGSNELLRIMAGGQAKKIPNTNKVWANGTIQAFSENGSLWISARNKNLQIPQESIAAFLELLTQLNNQSILAVDIQDNSIVTLSTEGIFEVQEGKLKYDTLSKIDFGNKLITSFAVQDDRFYWIGTWGYGIILIDRQDKSQRTISRIDGLNSDVIFNLKNVNGNVYVGTPRGIDLVSTSKLEVDIRHLSDDIIPTNQNSFYYDSESNVIWFGSNAKCYYYKVGSPFKRPPTAQIEKVTFYSEGLNDTIQASIGTGGSTELYFDENNVEFQFIGISLSFPEAVSYSTRLIGWDSTWSYPSNERFVRYTSLPPGEYRFEVMAISYEGVASLEGSAFQFVIRNSIWRQPWLILGFMFILLLIGWAALKLLERKRILATEARARQEQEVMEQVRKNIARDFHDNIGNKLAGLKLTSNLMRLKLTGENQELNNLLSEIEKSSQDLFERTKDFIWSIDPESDNLIEVFTYIKDFGERFFERTQFKFYSNLGSSGNTFVKIPTGWSRQMVMIFKEAMTNTFKHSNGDIVNLQLDFEPNRFDFSYSDNGEFGGQKNHSGRGLKNMMERANSINCQLIYDFTETRVKITLSGVLLG